LRKRDKSRKSSVNVAVILALKTCGLFSSHGLGVIR